MKVNKSIKTNKPEKHWSASCRNGHISGRLMHRVVIFVCIVACLSGCASGPPYSEVSASPNNKAIVYIYRPDHGFNAAGWPNIYINDEEIFSLKNNGYGVFFLSPGEHKVKAQGSKYYTNWYPNRMETTFSFEANKTYYIRIVPKMTSLYFVGSVVSISGEANISILPKDEAEQEIRETTKIAEQEIVQKNED